MLASFAEYVWYSSTASARIMRNVLRPLSWIFAIAVAKRNRSYDARQTRASAAGFSGRSLSAMIPALSVGNLTVGGTGKTPVAAWCVAQLRARGAHPAIVMRGVGDDEWRVHGLLNPRTQVIVSADRTAGMITAQSRGADCVVLDDAFQHRRAKRVVDLVLVSADRWTDDVRLLPAGPFREPLSSLQRASLVVVTVKAASADRLDQTLAAIGLAAPSVPVAVIRLEPGELRLATSVRAGDGIQQLSRGANVGPRKALLTRPPTWLNGREIHTVSAIGDPGAFEWQLKTLGASVQAAHRFRDHHTFTVHDAAMIARKAHDAGNIVCTLKDAVKLGPLWPAAAPPLWYLSQTVVVVRGEAALNRACDRLVASRLTTKPSAGASGPDI